MSKRMEENIFAGLLLIVFISVIIMSFGYGERARLVPVPIAVGSVILTVAQLVILNFSKNIDLSVDASTLFRSTKSGKTVQAERKNLEDSDIKVRKIEGGKEIVGLGLVGLFLLLILLIGLLPAAFVFVLGYFIIIGKMKWFKALFYTVVCEASLYFLFFSLLEVQVEKGWLLSLIMG